MKKIIITNLLLLLFLQVNFAQPYDTLWTKTIQHEWMGNPFQSVGHAAIQLADGNFVAAGFCSDPFIKAKIIKTDQNGNVIWAKQYPNVPLESFYCTDMKQTSDGGFILFGHGQSTTQPLFGFRLLKLDANGDYEWDNFYATSSTTDTTATTGKLAIAPDGGFVMVGFRGYWKPGTPGDMVGDPVIMKADASGNFLWYKVYGEPDHFNYFLDIEAGYGGGYWACGLTYSSNVHGEMLFVKIDEDGNQTDVKLHGTPQNFDEARSITKTPDGGYIVGGVWSESGIQMSLLKMDSECNLVWVKEFGLGEESQNACVAGVSNNGNYLLGGWHRIEATSEEEHWLVATDDSGSQIWELRYHTSGLDSEPYSIEKTNDGGFIVCGSEETSPGVVEIILIRISGGTTDVNENETTVTNYSLSQNYPNPFNPTTTINFNLENSGNVKLSVFDSLGKEVAVIHDAVLETGYHTVKFDAAHLTSGIYFYKISTDNFSSVKKMMLLK